jgi:hypothetical protein
MGQKIWSGLSDVARGRQPAPPRLHMCVQKVGTVSSDCFFTANPKYRFWMTHLRGHAPITRSTKLNFGAFSRRLQASAPSKLFLTMIPWLPPRPTSTVPRYMCDQARASLKTHHLLGNSVRGIKMARWQVLYGTTINVQMPVMVRCKLPKACKLYVV